MGWIGLQDFLKEGTFSWADGSSLGSYTNWANNQPDNNGQGQVWMVTILWTTFHFISSIVPYLELRGIGMM